MSCEVFLFYFVLFKSVLFYFILLFRNLLRLKSEVGCCLRWFVDTSYLVWCWTWLNEG
ncbi:hypothetical protein BDV23DRAFT_149155 [Aspergillus alliaceus]|uniref:Uncharacterized protein n=1 Tax=Petromyces alliaceus TaxID=209559 RepID=A0A5N7CJT4_PETAA|nr:hypothetical protein BDV23DRAFT_149155 [Aspergillus alliaceus]